MLVENYRPGAFEALGLGYEDLRKINPKLIYASFSAFGQGGPKRERTAYDHVIQSTSGIMAMTGTPEVNPIKIGAPAIDYATGTMGAYALSAALFQREKTGQGQRVDVAMFDVLLAMTDIVVNCPVLPAATAAGRRPSDARAVLPYLAMSYLYKRSNWLWYRLIRHRLTARVWRGLVEGSLPHILVVEEIRRESSVGTTTAIAVTTCARSSIGYADFGTRSRAWS